MNPIPTNPAMTNTLLFEHFVTLATAPEGIARLRELILQLAVQGKLGTQDAGDEPASVLAKKLQIERKQQIKENIIREEDLGGPVKDSEKRFEIPKNWEWIRFGDEIFVIRGGSPRPKGDSRYFSSTPTKHHWIKISDIRKYSDGIHLSNTDEYLTDEGVKHSVPVRKGTLVLTNSATIGVPIFLDIDGCIHDGYLAFPFLKDTLIDSKFLFYFFKSLKSYLETIAPGGGQLNLNRSIVKNLAFALPPLAEQHRIVTKIDQLMAICDELEARQQQERAGCLKLGTASLAGLQNAESPEEFGGQWAQVCDAFDLILDCPENVAVLRQTILQLAVQGWLVQQEPSDEPAKKLVEKIKKDKMLLIKQDKIPAEKPVEPAEESGFLRVIPKNWSLARFGEISNKIQYGYTASADHTNKKVRLIRITDIQNSRVIWDTVPGCEIDDSNYSSYAIGVGDLLIARTGGTIGKSYLVREIPVPAVFASYLIRIVPNKNLDPEYVKLFADSPTYWNQLYEKCMGTGQPNVNGTSLRSLIVPLPPLAEQHRIVAKVDALMALCDALESRLKEMAGVQARLAGAVVKQVANI